MKKKKFMFIILFAFAFAVAANAFVEENYIDEAVVSELAQNTTDSCNTCNTCDPCASDPCEPCKPCCTEVPKTGEPSDSAYNAPARIDPACGLKAWVTASFIYWQAKERGLELGYFQTGVTPNFSYEKLNLSHDFKPGFKVGAGFSMCRDDWTLYLEYTRLEGHHTSTHEDAVHLMRTPWFHPLTSFENKGDFAAYSYLKGNWGLDYNVFDLELGRPYYVGKKVIFKPFYCVRGGWLDQSYHANGTYFYSSAYHHVIATNKSESWFVGPRAGLDTDWMIGCNFRIFGNASAALLYQDYKASLYMEDVDDGSHIDIHDNMGLITPNAELNIGLGYGDYFCNKEWYFDFTVGYDLNYYWNQNFIRSLYDSFPARGVNSGGYYVYEKSIDSISDLMLHGLTVTARLDF